MKRNVRKPILFEIAWEVANKVGGIYTVIKTKVPVTVQEYTQSRYFLIGPLNAHKAALEVEHLSGVAEDAPSQVRHLYNTIEAMRSHGVNVVFGKWLIESSPYVILMDLNSVRYKTSEWRSDLYQKAGIPCPENDGEMDDAILFGYLVAWMLGEYAHRNQRQAILAQFHEWQSSVGLILAHHRQLNVATVFTTHATLLGRYLCAGQVDFYNSLHLFDVDYEAGRRGIYHRYCVERGAAGCSDVFTTVSHITAYEAENLLKRKPDGVTPNGLNLGDKSAALHEFQNLHARHKDQIHEFVRGHFYGHMDFDLDNTLYFFTAGRYEYRNKGVDLFLEALAQVNHRLKHMNSPITVVAFIIMPAAHHSYTVDALKGQAVVKQLRDTVNEVQQNVGKRIFEFSSHGHLPTSDELLTEEELTALKRRIFTINQRHTLPPIVTHNMQDDAHDPILNQIRRLNLINKREDRVKMVFHPEFLNSSNQVLSIDYEDFVRGCHMGVFPSFYEPWGYTPAECTVYGVPNVSTNLSGFGCFMEENIENPSDYGIYVLDRRLISPQESIDQLAQMMINFCQKSRRQRINQRNRTERLSDILDWKRMGLEYVKARRLALRRKFADSFDGEDEQSSEWHDVEEEEDLESDKLAELNEEAKEDREDFFDIKSHASANAESAIGIKVSTAPPLEHEDSGVISPLTSGRKISQPFSAPSSPKLQAMINKNVEGMHQLATGGDQLGGDSPQALSPQLQLSSEDVSTSDDRKSTPPAFKTALQQPSEDDLEPVQQQTKNNVEMRSLTQRLKDQLGMQ